MQLESGTRLGEYEIVASVGAGGMGEVYRARDHRLGRDVAVKILPESLLDNQDRLQRFQREARSAGGLNHPNLLTIHELGVDRGRPFIVSELLDGTTLRERMSAGALAPRRAIEYASQIAEGLAAAHERGIVHRDLKPENIFVTRDGRVKILDFGLAKNVGPAVADGSAGATVKKSLTDPGAVVGTVGYMSPEQVRGDSVDARSDIFTLGAILYEMLSGRRAFHGTSSVDTMHAILHSDPPELTNTSAQIPPALGRIVNHCLEKDPERRFQSAHDLAFDLESISGASTEVTAPVRRARTRVAPLWIAAIVVAAAAGWFAARATLHRSPPRFKRLTFQSRDIASAAFTPDGQSIVYSNVGTMGANDIEITPVGSADMRSTGIAHAHVLSVSRQGDLAILVRPRFIGAFITVGTLARVPLGGGAPREIADDVQWADWTPSGDDLVIVRTAGGKPRIELPIGHVLYEGTGWITSPKISPDGKSIAFMEHPVFGDDGGFVALLDADHKKHVLTPNYASAVGLAWRPDGKEVWYTASENGNSRALYGVGVSAKPRLIATAPGTLVIFDIARDGRVLLSESNMRQQTFIHGPNDARDRELSWLDWSRLRDMTPDGQRVLFDETGEGSGANYGVYMRDADGSPAIRLGDGIGCGFSPDGRSVLAIRLMFPHTHLVVYPTGTGQPREIPTQGGDINSAAWLPDGRSVLYRPIREGGVYEQNLAGGAPRTITAERTSGLDLLVSPDGRWVEASGPDGAGTLYSLRGELKITLPEITAADDLVGWTSDSKGLLYCRRLENPVRIRQLDVNTHASRLVREIDIPDSVYGEGRVRITPDGKTYAYCIYTSSADLYQLEGAN